MGKLVVGGERDLEVLVVEQYLGPTDIHHPRKHLGDADRGEPLTEADILVVDAYALVITALVSV